MCLFSDDDASARAQHIASARQQLHYACDRLASAAVRPVLPLVA